ncbi:putative NDK protein [Trypoxylus dichotomus]
MATQRERTFIMVKPDGVQRGIVGEIIKRFEQKGFKLVALKFVWPTEELLQKHYADLAGKPFFPGLIKYMSSGPVVPMVWEGLNSVKTGRVMLGATNPADSAPGTIRGDLCIQVGRNIIHGSDSVESANKEINLWFTEKEVVGWTPANEEHCEHNGNSISFPGIDGIPWELSQSGRRKQNFGPKCNFNKRKIQVGDFKGFPAFSKFVQDKFSSVEILKDFQTIEQCSLEYDPSRDENGTFCQTNNYTLQHAEQKLCPIVRIPMPRRSLLVMFGKARYEWEHQILREDIVEKRICLAYREFTPLFLEGGNYHELGKPILNIAKVFF